MQNQAFDEVLLIQPSRNRISRQFQGQFTSVLHEFGIRYVVSTVIIDMNLYISQFSNPTAGVIDRTEKNGFTSRKHG